MAAIIGTPQHRALAASFANHLQDLLHFHRDDDADSEGQFTADPVAYSEWGTLNPTALMVTLDSGQRLRVTVEVAP